MVWRSESHVWHARLWAQRIYAQLVMISRIWSDADSPLVIVTSRIYRDWKQTDLRMTGMEAGEGGHGKWSSETLCTPWFYSELERWRWDGNQYAALEKYFMEGWMLACFHCCGTVEVAREGLKNWAMGLHKTGDPGLMTQTGRAMSRHVRSNGCWVEFVKEYVIYLDLMGLAGCLRKGGV